MGWKGVLVVGAALLLGAGYVSAEIITIDRELPQLEVLRKAYEAELKTAATQNDIEKIQEEYEQAKKNLSKFEGYAQKLSTLEEAKKKEIEVITAKYLKEQEKLDTATRKGIDDKYEKKIAELKNRDVAKTTSSYQAKLEKLEKELVGKNDLAGALVVQSERKKVSGAPVVPSPVLPGTAAAPVAVSEPPTAAVVANVSASAGGKGKDNQIHVNSVHGVAGAEGNISNNIYTFTLDSVGGQSKLVFYGYGNRSGNSYGRVYLIGPDRNRTEVARWRPDLLKGPNVSDFKSYTQVQPITADISSQVKQPGQYRVEFQYTDGDDALNIYRVEMQTR
ncbi:MAG: hypothetical protein OEV89_09060 [Desulfobulbaceae bacterium]|nr:hypothetical protein [Desulfobulbaceae bacterium]HIJ90839.1 hypothetical protein [Deltaproteobacteria bacterium]